jgi:hypothetical protein
MPIFPADSFVAKLSPDGLEDHMVDHSGRIEGRSRIGSGDWAWQFGLRDRKTQSTDFPTTPVFNVSLSAIGRVSAIGDNADNEKIVSIAPGQLIALFGTNLAPEGIAPSASGFPISFNGVTVTFNGIAAPILYTSGVRGPCVGSGWQHRSNSSPPC